MTDPTNRLPADTTLGRVSLDIADLDRSIGYYTRVLGFRLINRDERSARLGASDGPALVELRKVSGAEPMPSRGRLGLYHFAILLPDRASLGRLVSHLSSLNVRIGAADHLVSEAIYLHDPDGLGIEVYADRPRDTWDRRGGEIAMDTLALDLADLVRAAGDEPWSGYRAERESGTCTCTSVRSRRRARSTRQDWAWNRWYGLMQERFSSRLADTIIISV